MTTQAEPPPTPARLFDLTGQVALVTGATRGIGWAVTRTLAAAGARVVLNARSQQDLDIRRDELAAVGYSADVDAFDAADAARTAAAVEGAVARHRRLDIVVANAAATVRKPITEQTDEDWSNVIDVALTAPWRLAREAARVMIPARYGRIIVVSSVNAVVARPGLSPYVTAKAGLNGLVRALALDLAPHGITANAVAPGYILTEGNAAFRSATPGFESRIAARTPAGRWGTAQEIAAAVLYLASPSAGFTTGSVLSADGGLSVAI